jgi:hypothetical protein
MEKEPTPGEVCRPIELQCEEVDMDNEYVGMASAQGRSNTKSVLLGNWK